MSSSGSASLEGYSKQLAPRLAVWPNGGGYRAFAPGRTVFDLVKGTISFPSNLMGKGNDAITPIKSLGAEKYRCAVLFLDQPCRIQIDESPWWLAFEQGVHELHCDIHRWLAIENYMPMAGKIIFSPEDRAPLNVSSTKMPFKRSGKWVDVQDVAFAVVPMFPLTYEPGYNSGFLGQPSRETVLQLVTGASLSDEQGAAVISNVSNLMLSVRNPATADKCFALKAEVKGRDADEGVAWQQFEALTGTRATLIRFNCEGKFVIDGGQYYKLRVQKLSLNNTTTSGRLELTGVIGGGV